MKPSDIKQHIKAKALAPKPTKQISKNSIYSSEDEEASKVVKPAAKRKNSVKPKVQQRLCQKQHPSLHK